jgi:hypothetical protein
MAFLFKNSTNKSSSVSLKTLATTLPAQVCTFILFLLILRTVPFNTLRLASFGLLKVVFRGRRFADDDELKDSVSEEHRRFSETFYATGMRRLT